MLDTLDDLEPLIGDLVETDWQRLADDELLDAVRRVETCSRRLHAASLALTRVIDDRGVAGGYGATSTSALLRQLLRISPREAKKRVETAKDVTPSVTPTGATVEPKLPEAATALQAGEISDDHLQVLRHTLHKLPDNLATSTLQQVEETLVAQAHQFDPLLLGRLARRIHTLLDPDGALRSEKEATALRELVITRDTDGMYRLRGKLDAEGATTLIWPRSHPWPHPTPPWTA